MNPWWFPVSNATKPVAESGQERNIEIQLPSGPVNVNFHLLPLQFKLPNKDVECILLYRYWWNTRIFPFTKQSYLHCAQWRYHFHLLCMRILVLPWLLTWLANYKRAMNKKKKLCFMWEIHQYLYNKQNILWPLGDTNFIFLCWKYMYISRPFTLLTCERYFQHSKIKFVSPCGHKISSTVYQLQYSSTRYSPCSVVNYEVTCCIIEKLTGWFLAENDHLSCWQTHHRLLALAHWVT